MKNILYIALLLVSFTTYSSAQVVLDGKAEVKNVKIEQVEGAKLRINMDVDVTQTPIKSNQELQLTPRFTNGEQVKDLPTLVIAGRKSNIYRKRNPQYFSAEDNALVVRKDKKKAQVLNYSTEVDFESWMNGADLEVVENSCGCATTVLASNDHKLDRFILPPAVLSPYISYIEPAVEEQKNRSIEASAYLDFPVNQTAIRPEFRNNRAELAKISESINKVAQDGDVNVSSIKLTGHASPEGSYAGNERLARLRTEALKNHLITIYPRISPSTFKVDFVAENWEGLIKMLNESTSFTYKHDILRIIEENNNLDVREQKIRALDGGKAYRALVNDYFPALRNTNYEIKYIIRQFTVEEAKEMVWTEPQKLSLEEIYRVSEGYKDDADKYAELFEIAVRLYPTDDIANLNASTSALRVKDLPRAKRYLDRVSPDSQDAEYFNNRGVYSFMIDDYQVAKDFFNKAISKGSTNAQENLKQLENKLEYDRLFNR